MEAFLTALATSSVVSGLVSIGVTRALKRRDDEDLKRAMRTAIEIEVDLAAQFALAYLQPGAVRSPMHRILTSFYDENAAKLLALKGLDEEALRALMIYYQNINQMNRSLDRVLELQADPERKHDEMNRAFIKACSLVSVADLQRLAAAHEQASIARRSLLMKRSKYGESSPYDRVKAAIA